MGTRPLPPEEQAGPTSEQADTGIEAALRENAETISNGINGGISAFGVALHQALEPQSKSIGEASAAVGRLADQLQELDLRAALTVQADALGQASAALGQLGSGLQTVLGEIRSIGKEFQGALEVQARAQTASSDAFAALVEQSAASPQTRGDLSGALDRLGEVLEALSREREDDDPVSNEATTALVKNTRNVIVTVVAAAIVGIGSVVYSLNATVAASVARFDERTQAIQQAADRRAETVDKQLDELVASRREMHDAITQLALSQAKLESGQQRIIEKLDGLSRP